MAKVAAAAALLILCVSETSAQTTQKERLTLGGYGEVALTRNFYNDSPYLYARPSKYKDAPGHGRFDIPHAVIYIG